jgi:hypothetical protein
LSLKVSDGALLLDRRRLTKSHAATPAIAIPMTPPTDPPAISPTCEPFEVEVDDGDCAVEDPVTIVVKEADTLAVEETIELVDCAWVAVDSGVSK